MNSKIFLWDDKMPNQTGEKSEAVIEFDKDSNTKKLLEVTNPLIEVFETEENNTNKNAILICPGGSYKQLSIEKEGSEPALWLNKLGFTAYVLHYRVPNNREAAFNDIQRAFKIIKNKFNHPKIGVLGFSAGGNLCARLCTNFSQISYAINDETDTEPCKPDFTLLIYPAYLDEGKNKTISPNLVADKNIPPTFIFGTKDDEYYNSIPVFTKYLKELNATYELQTLTFGGHGYGLRKGNNAAETWPILAEKWLKTST